MADPITRARASVRSFPVAPLIGREPEIRTLTALVDGLRDGRGGAVLIEGSAGIGKTRLVESTLEAADEIGARSAFAAADPLGVRRPFHVALAVAASLDPSNVPADARLRELLDAVRRRAGSVPLVPPGSARVAVVDAIVAEFERRATSPLVLAIEDLQWVDDASLSALRALLPLVEVVPLLLVVSARPGTERPGDAATRAEIASAGAVLHVEELSDEEVLALAHELVGAPADAELASVLGRLGGNPFVVSEFLREQRARDALAVRNGHAALVAGAGDAAIADVKMARLRSIGAATLAMLRPASVLGSSFTVRDLVELTGTPAGALAEPVATAISSSLLGEDGSELRFTHELLRAAIYEDVPASLRAALHEQAARILAARGAGAVAVATHAALGAATADAVHWLRSAASDVMSVAPGDALAMLDDALGRGVPDDAVRAAIQRARVESLMGVGRLEDAGRLGEQLVDHLGPDDRSELRTRLAGVLVLLNRTGEAIVHLDRAATEARSEADRALAIAHGAMARMTIADLHESARLARDAAAIGERTGESSARTLAASVLGRLPCFAHGYREGMPAARVAVEIADADPTGRAHDYVPWFWVGVIALDLDDFELVDAALRAGRARADEGYAAWAHPLYCGLAASAHHRRGRLDDARAEASAGVSLSLDTGSSQARMWCESLLAIVCDLAGETDERDAYAAAASASWERGNALLGIDHFAIAQSLAAGADGAHEHLAGGWALFSDIGNLNCQPLLAVPLVRACAGRDDARAAEVREAMRAAARLTDLPGLRAVSVHVDGLVDGDPDALVRAAEQLGALGRELDRAEALADAARVRARAGRPSSDLEDLATEAFARCGAHGAVRRLQGELADGAGRRRPRASVGWDALTRTERAVAALVGEGLTNSEIAARRGVSRRTIESHLLRIYTKLGHSSRTRLAVEASARSAR